MAGISAVSAIGGAKIPAGIAAVLGIFLAVQVRKHFKKALNDPRKDWRNLTFKHILC